MQGINPTLGIYLFSLNMSYLRAILGIGLVHSAARCAEFAAISAIFALLGRVVRGVTTGGAVVGAMICFALLWAGGFAAFAALFTVFLLTWASTRVAYTRKQSFGTAEARSGRNAFQVLANLGVSAGCAVVYARFPNPWVFAGMAAALAEAAADTVSSEIGQALGGTPRLVTTWRPVVQGANGAITWIGTLAGGLAAMVVAMVFYLSGALGRGSFVGIAFAAVAGMTADSLMGATVEGHGWIGNNTVNFLSTLVAAIIAFIIVS